MWRGLERLVPNESCKVCSFGRLGLHRVWPIDCVLIVANLEPAGIANTGQKHKYSWKTLAKIFFENFIVENRSLPVCLLTPHHACWSCDSMPGDLRIKNATLLQIHKKTFDTHWCWVLWPSLGCLLKDNLQLRTNETCNPFPLINLCDGR